MDESPPPTDRVPEEKPQKTWFFKRTGDNFIFPTDEKGAWGLLNNRNKWMRNDFKMLGVSNGVTYFKMKREAKSKVISSNEELNEVKKEKVLYGNTLKRFKYDELLEDTDERVLKAKEMVKKTEDKMKVVSDQLKNISAVIEKEAFEAELAIAVANGVSNPSNQDIITPDSKDRAKILRQMGQ